MKKYIIGIAAVVVIAVMVIVLLASNSGKKDPVVVTPVQGRYVALGDSVVAGVGLEDYSDSSACDRTKQAYPNKVASQLHYDLDTVACGGATTQKGLLGAQEVNQLAVPPQVKTALTGKKPALISLTIGANDADWTTFIQKCYTGVCGSATDTTTVNASVNMAATNIEKALAQIKDAYPTETPKVAVTGYYKLFPTGEKTSCTELTGVDQAERAWVGQLQNNLDTAIKSAAAKYSFAVYVPIDFTGHELCTDASWIQGLGSKAPFHPTDAGQTTIANQIVSALKAKEPAQ